MFLPDLTFSFLLAAVDLLAVAFCLTERRRARPLTVVLTLLGLFFLSALALSSAVNEFFGFRMFGVLRFMGQAGAIHLPLLLLAFSLIYRGEGMLSRLCALTALMLAAGATFAYHIEPYRLEVTRVSVTSPRLEGLERPIRILQVADIQTDRIGPYEKRVLEEMRRLEPDLIVYLGDYVQIVDPERRASVSGAFRMLLTNAGLNPPFGSYAIQGDCERWSGWEAMFSGTSVEVLGNEARAVKLPGATVNLVALDVEASRTRELGKLRSLAGAGSPGALDIFLGHSPDFSDQLAPENQPFLALAGHTHGGQVRVPFWGAPITYSRLPRRTVDAFERFGGGVLSVSRGIGMERHEAPRVRFLCRPELRVVTLVPPGAEERGTLHIPDSELHVASD